MTAPRRILLSKHHGLGNDFLVLLEPRNPGVRPDPEDARRWCARHRGIGADGLLYGMSPESPGTDLRMRLFNADGSEAEISGNGIRCLAQAALRHDGRRSGSVVIDTAAGVRTLDVEPTDDPAVDLARVDMGVVQGGPAIPASLDTRAMKEAKERATFDVGNPHLVLLVASLDDVDPTTDGREIEAAFDGGINVHFLVADGPDRIRVRHWERGAGLTEACGSGAVASAAAARDWGLAGDAVEVHMPGGAARVNLGPTATLTGPAAHVADIEVTA